MSNNGHRHTFGQKLQALAGHGNAPIVGLPFVLEGWFIQLLITCKCEQPKPVLVLGQPGTAAGQCSSCHKIYTLQSIGIDPRTGQPHFQVAMAMPQEAPPAPPDPDR